MVLKVTCALIVENNKLLITQNSLTSDHPLLWEFPGGKIKKGEKSNDCIIREIKEELDIDVQILKELQPVIFDYGLKKIELIPFLCRIHSGEIKLNEHLDFAWIKFNEMERTDFSGADRKLVQQIENSVVLKKHLGE